MQAERKVVEESQPMESAEMAEVEADAQRLAHSLLAVLMPANPPQPKNARVIRLFDYEAAKNDPQAGAASAQTQVQTQAQEPTAREAAKAARKLSLFAAAGLA